MPGIRGHGGIAMAIRLPSARCEIEPAKLPLPTPHRRPFQPVAGSQTSKRMSESLEGRALPTTRQKAESSGFPLMSSALKCPAATASALSTTALGRGSPTKPVQSLEAGPVVTGAVGVAVQPARMIGSSQWARPT